MNLDWLADVSGAVRLTRVDWAVPTSKLTSRIVARVRLQDIIRRDREACGDGGWELAGINLSGFYLESCLMKKKNVAFENKPRYRWVKRT